jgi:broad specificity phosphatase PhoE
MPRYTTADWPERLWIVRHGQSAGNLARDAAEADGKDLIELATRDADTPLSPLGEEQSRALGEWFAEGGNDTRADVLLTSPFVRSRQTLSIIAEALGMDRGKIQSDERLREKEFGILDRYTKHGVGETFPAIAAQRALVGKFYFRPPGGESWCDVILRLRSVVEELRRDYAGRRVLIVSHQVVVNCFRYLLERMDEEAILAIDRQGDVPNCSVTEYGFREALNDRRFGLVRANEIVALRNARAPVTEAPDHPTGPK